MEFPVINRQIYRKRERERERIGYFMSDIKVTTSLSFHYVFKYTLVQERGADSAVIRK
jgi:hypothetical protein